MKLSSPQEFTLVCRYVTCYLHSNPFIIHLTQLTVYSEIYFVFFLVIYVLKSYIYFCTGAGQGFGEIALINADCTRTASIICESKVKLLSINRQVMVSLRTNNLTDTYQGRTTHPKSPLIFSGVDDWNLGQTWVVFCYFSDVYPILSLFVCKFCLLIVLNDPSLGWTKSFNTPLTHSTIYISYFIVGKN